MGTAFKRLLIVAVLIVDGIGLAAFGWIRLKSAEELDGRGVVTTGRVIDHAMGQYSKRSASYTLTVEFMPTNAAKIATTLDVDGSTYNSAIKDGSVAVRYLPDDPTRCMAGKMSILPFKVVFVLGLGMLGSGFLLMTWFAVRTGF